MTRIIWLLVGVLVAISSTGCSSEQGQVTDEEVDQLIDFVNGDAAVNSLYLKRDQLHREETITCMQNQGFAYEVEAPEKSSPPTQNDGEIVDFSWVVSLRESIEANPIETSAGVDPAQSEGERTEYDRALWGTDPSKPIEERDGCYWTALGAANQTSGVAKLREMALPISEAADDALNSVEYAQIHDDWQTCMRNAGYDVGSIPDMYELVRELWQTRVDGAQDDAPALVLEQDLFRQHNICNTATDEWFSGVVRQAATEVLVSEDG